MGAELAMAPKCTVSCTPSSTQLLPTAHSALAPSADTDVTVRYALVVSEPVNRYCPTKMLLPGARPEPARVG
jgi:hypothetical protein